MDKLFSSIICGAIVIFFSFLISIRLNSNLILIFIFALLFSMFMIIYIKPNIYPVRIIYMQIIYNFFIKFAIQYFRVPSSANYLTDVFTVMAMVYAFIELYKKRREINTKLPMVIITIFIIITISGFIINGQSVLLYLWGVRNNFRFFGFFFSCAVLLKKKDIDYIFKALLFIFFINTIFATVQYFVFGLRGDYLGGIFGTVQGVNGYLNIFLCIECTIVLVQYLYKKISVYLLTAVIFSSIFISVLSELKVFFIEFGIIIICLMIFSKPSKKIYFIVLMSMLSLYIGIQFLYIAFPNFNNFFNIDTIIASSQNYATKHDLGRFSATKIITQMFFSDDNMKCFLGLGLGSAETSQISMFNSDFFNKYGGSMHYTWLSSAFMLIENGWLGLICYLSFFVSIVFSVFRIRNIDEGNIDYCIITQIIAVLCCLFVFYNSSLRTEAAYFVYFMLSLAFAISNYDIVSELKI